MDFAVLPGGSSNPTALDWLGPFLCTWLCRLGLRLFLYWLDEPMLAFTGEAGQFPYTSALLLKPVLKTVFIVRPLFWLNIVLCFLALVCMYVQIYVYISKKVKLLFNFFNVIKNKSKCIIISENERNISILAL